MNHYFGQKYFGKILPAGAIGGRERPYVQNFGSEVQISKQLDLAQLSSAILKNGENAGPLGQILALTAVMTLITACGSAPNAGPEISHTLTPTPDNPTPPPAGGPTHTLTPTSTHTLTPTSTLLPSPSRTPTFAAPTSEPRSQFSASDNKTVAIENGVASVIKSNFSDWHTNSYQTVKADGKYRFLNYAAARRFLEPPKGLFGDFRLPKRELPDWWEKDGGLGFTLSDPVYFDSEAFAKPVGSLLVKNKIDGFSRFGVVLPQRFFEVGIIQASRAAAANRWSSEDFTKFGPGSALAAHDAEIKELFDQMLADSGYRPIGIGSWPGPVDLASLSDDELAKIVQSGRVCIEERPVANDRSGQKPEIVREVDYRADAETRSPDDDESRILFDEKTDVVEWFVLNPKAPWRKSMIVVIENAGSPPDNLWPKRPGQNVADVNKVVNIAGEFSEWRPCGPAQPGIEVSKTPTPTVTSVPTLTPTPPERKTPVPPPEPPRTPQPPSAPEKSLDPYVNQADRENKGTGGTSGKEDTKDKEP